MIKGINTMFYSSKAKELREFLRDKIGFKATDIGDGWLVFDIVEGGDMGVESSDESGQHGKPSGTHHISFYCDNIDETVKELKSKGVEFKGEIEDLGWGLVTYFKVPGDFFLQLYQPKYKK
ncbi:VOC family protein [Spongiimicrobium sp. 2-473A-2-J]|uniref:VOC family protein n=1 Tax=Eudoraea algarum TaxID=3417568 RepID=UPI003D360232